ICPAINRWRKATSVPLLNGACSVSRQSNTSCQRRSISIASITSSSETPVYACTMVARANCAGGRNRRLPTETRCIECRQFILKSVIKDLVAVMTEKDKQLRSFDACDDGLLNG